MLAIEMIVEIESMFVDLKPLELPTEAESKRNRYRFYNPNGMTPSNLSVNRGRL
jgi:hypothetical protein